MGLLDRFGFALPRPSGRRAGSRPPRQENMRSDPATEGRLDPSTAALTEGSPPGSTSGRHQPHRTADRKRDGASEDDTRHLPG